MLDRIINTAENREEQLVLIELVTQLMCEQIHRDYQVFITNRLLALLPQGLDIGWRESRILQFLRREMKPCSPSRISDGIQLDAGTITRGVQDLQERGFVEISDGFRKEISLNNVGLNWVNEHNRLAEVASAKAMAETKLILSESVADQIINLLLALRDRSSQLANLDFSSLERVSLPSEVASKGVTQVLRLKYFDYAVEIYSSQITRNYKRFIEKHILNQDLLLKKLNIGDLRVLMAIRHFKGSAMPNEIAETLRFDPATITRSIKKLEKLALVKRDYDSHDKRSFYVTATDEGQKAAKVYKSIALDKLSKAEAFLKLPSLEEQADFILDALKFARDRSEAFAALRAEKPVKEAIVS